MSAVVSQRLGRGDRVRERRDYQRISREGARMSSRSFLVLSTPTRVEGRTASRLGITASRKVGPSVVRSRVKRRIREWFRRHRDELPEGRDVVVIARVGAAGLDQRSAEAELSGIARRMRAAVASART